MIDKYDGDYARALAAYNRGPKKIPLTGKAEFNPETYDYVGSILDPASAVNLFDVGEYPVGVAVREDVQSILDLAEGDETVSELVDSIKKDEEDEAYDAVVGQYLEMTENQNKVPEFIDPIQPQKRVNVLRSLGIGSIFE